MTLHKPWIMQPVVADPDLTYTAQEIRMVSTALGTMSGEGVFGPSDFNVTQRAAGANFSVDVAAGICGTMGTDISNQGLYLTWNDATVNIATPTAPASGTRIHRLVLQVRDKLSSGAYTTYDAVLSVLPDTGGGTPAEPASATTLALITITSASVSVANAQINVTPLIWNDIWHSINGLQSNGWSIGSHDLPESGYRFRPGDPSMIEFMAFYSTVGTSANGTLMTQLPARYGSVGSFQRIGAGGTQGGSGINNTPYVSIDATGAIGITSMGTETEFQLSGAYRHS